MTGLENISANNGWAMAAAGIGIVFFGLILLSFAISQLHRILDILERLHTFTQRKKNKEQIKPVSDDEPEPPLTDIIEETIRNYQMLSRRIGDPFSLPKLLDLAEKCGLTKPYSTINMLIVSEIIVPDGNGYFIWKH